MYLIAYLFFLVPVLSLNVDCDFDIYNTIQQDRTAPYVIRDFKTAVSKDFKSAYTFYNLNKTLHNVKVPTMLAHSYPTDIVEKTFHEYLTEDLNPFLTVETDTYNDRMLLPMKFENGQRQSVIPLTIRNLHTCDYMKDLYDSVEKEYYIGSAGQGANFHKHMEIYNQVIHGEKIWFLAFKESDVSSIAGEKLLVDNLWSVLNNENIKKCKLYENDIIYVPSNVYHATFNLKPTLAAACFPWSRL